MPHLVLCALFLVMLAACETTTSGGAVGADRPQLMLVSSQQLQQMGAESYAKLLADAARKGVLNRDGAMLQRVRAVASRIEPQTAVFRRDAPGWKWEVNLLPTPATTTTRSSPTTCSRTPAASGPTASAPTPSTPTRRSAASA